MSPWCCTSSAYTSACLPAFVKLQSFSRCSNSTLQNLNQSCVSSCCPLDVPKPSCHHNALRALAAFSRPVGRQTCSPWMAPARSPPPKSDRCGSAAGDEHYICQEGDLRNPYLLPPAVTCRRCTRRNFEPKPGSLLNA